MTFCRAQALAEFFDLTRASWKDLRVFLVPGTPMSTFFLLVCPLLLMLAKRRGDLSRARGEGPAFALTAVTRVFGVFMSCQDCRC